MDFELAVTLSMVRANGPRNGFMLWKQPQAVATFVVSPFCRFALHCPSKYFAATERGARHVSNTGERLVRSSMSPLLGHSRCRPTAWCISTLCAVTAITADGG